jgi:hypothetical protein
MTPSEQPGGKTVYRPERFGAWLCFIILKVYSRGIMFLCKRLQNICAIRGSLFQCPTDQGRRIGSEIFLRPRQPGTEYLGVVAADHSMQCNSRLSHNLSAGYRTFDLNNLQAEPDCSAMHNLLTVKAGNCLNRSRRGG